MERLKHMKETLTCLIENQMSHLDQVDTKELGEAIDMIKDLEEAIYYCTITEAMEGKEKGQKQPHEEYYYRERYDRDMDRHEGRMYYPYPVPMYYSEGSGSSQGSSSNSSSGSGRSNSGNNNSSTNYSSGGMRNFSEREVPMEMYDHREGRSPRNRRMYMEAKETHQDKVTQMRELEKYMQELSQDIVDMISDASPEEKQYLEKKLTTLASKVQQMK